MFLSLCVCGVQQATQRQSSLVSATHYFMFQVKYHYKKPIDHAAVNSAKLMTKTTNVILGPVTGSGCFCSHFRGVRTQFGQQHVPHLEIKQRSLQYHPLSLCLSLSLARSLPQQQLTHFQTSTDVKLLYNQANGPPCTIALCAFARKGLVSWAFDFNMMTSHPSH